MGLIDFDQYEKYNANTMLVNLKEKLAKTRKTFKVRIDDLIAGKKGQEEILERLEESLILADTGVNTTEKIINHIRENSNKSDSFETIKALLEAKLTNILSQCVAEERLQGSQSVVMFVGINGGGKTTSLAKLAYSQTAQGKKVMMVAADTFRAAAQEQLALWGKKLNIPVIKGQYGADPASVAYDALQSFKAKQFDILLVDTAGRIHTNANLMSELEKIKKIIAREVEGAPQEILLVLDASIGQNALFQAREFLKFSGLTGIFLSKLDGTAKGGSVIGIADELHLPIKYIGIGEGETDVVKFSPIEFVNALLS